MRYFFYVVFFVLLTSGCEITPVSNSEKAFGQIQDPPNIKKQNSQQRNQILAKDYEIAKKTLDKAVMEKDLETIRLGLKGFSFQIKKDVVAEILKLDDKRFIPDLIEALENNQGALSGNEVAVLQAELSGIIISAIEQFTGLKFEYKLDPTKVPVMNEEDDVQRIIKQSKLWWDVNKNEFQKN